MFRNKSTVLFIVTCLLAFFMFACCPPVSEKTSDKKGKDVEETKKEPTQTKQKEEPKEVQPSEPPKQAPAKLSLDEMYEKIQKDMTEQQVKEIAGEPDMTSQATIEGFGEVVNLVYYEGTNNLTVSVQNGTAKVIVLGKFENGKMNTKSKM